MATAAQFADAALALKGARFLHLGRSRTRLDCAGLVFVAAWSCGIAVRDFRDYEPTPKGDVVLAAVADRCVPRAWHEWQMAGRVVVLRHRDDGEPRHFAVSLGGGLGIHQESRATILDLNEHQDRIHRVMLLGGVVA